MQYSRPYQLKTLNLNKTSTLSHTSKRPTSTTTTKTPTITTMRVTQTICQPLQTLTLRTFCVKMRLFLCTPSRSPTSNPTPSNSPLPSSTSAATTLLPTRLLVSSPSNLLNNHLTNLQVLSKKMYGSHCLKKRNRSHSRSESELRSSKRMRMMMSLSWS